MDRLLMLYRRAQLRAGFLKDRFVYMGADSSPQLQENYMIIREELVYIPQCSPSTAEPLAAVSVESRTKPPTTLAWGEGSLAKKLCRVAHSILLDAGQDGASEYLSRVRGCYSDQGTEKALWESPNIIGQDSLRE
eukprot:1994861-Lingulodinium_polyedra.AAC.1